MSLNGATGDRQERVDTRSDKVISTAPKGLAASARIRFFALASCFLLSTGCASTRLAHDPWCREIAAFANSIAPDETRAIELGTVWGSSEQFPRTLYSKQCGSDGYEPGRRLCAYLLENSSSEFADLNFRRSLACLNRTPWRTTKAVMYERLDAEVLAFGGAGIRDDVEMRLSFRYGAEGEPDRLVISAHRYED